MKKVMLLLLLALCLMGSISALAEEITDDCVFTYASRSTGKKDMGMLPT